MRRASRWAADPTGVVGYSASGTSTATKTNTPIMDIPQSITIVTQQQLKDRDSVSLQEALTYVPGVTVAGGEGNKDQIVIRGQTTTADFYKDGVRDDAEYIRDLYNIQSVEVLKGPSALTFGRGGAGGIVNRVTKKADGESIQELDISAGSFGRKRVTIDWGGAVSEQFAARLNGMYEQSYGYRNFFRDERYGISPTFTWKVDESTLFWLTYEHYRDRRTADRGINSAGLSSIFPDLPGDFMTLESRLSFAGSELVLLWRRQPERRAGQLFQGRRELGRSRRRAQDGFRARNPRSHPLRRLSKALSEHLHRRARAAFRGRGQRH